MISFGLVGAEDAAAPKILVLAAKRRQDRKRTGLKRVMNKWWPENQPLLVHGPPQEKVSRKYRDQKDYRHAPERAATIKEKCCPDGDLKSCQWVGIHHETRRASLGNLH